MTSQERRDELVTQARRLVAIGLIEERFVSINDNAGTIRHRLTDTLYHYESGVTVSFAPWPQRWVRA